MKFITFMFSLCIFCCISHAAARGNIAINRFADPAKYPVKIYKGELHMPSSFKSVLSGSGRYSWEDEYGKRVGDPEINYAGKYYISARLCDPPCQKYRMHDLSTGNEFPINEMLLNFEQPPETDDKWDGYYLHLCYRANSNLLLVRHNFYKEEILENDDRREIYYCVEQSYIFKNGEFKAISGRRSHCVDWDRFRLGR